MSLCPCRPELVDGKRKKAKRTTAVVSRGYSVGLRKRGEGRLNLYICPRIALLHPSVHSAAIWQPGSLIDMHKNVEVDTRATNCASIDKKHMIALKNNDTVSPGCGFWCRYLWLHVSFSKVPWGWNQSKLNITHMIGITNLSVQVDYTAGLS
jgi:hypothetical protein